MASEGGTKRLPFYESWRRHPLTISDAVVLASVCLVVLSLVRVFLVARFDEATVLATLSVLDRTQVLFATFASAAPPLVLSFLFFTWLKHSAHSQDEDVNSAWFTALQVPLVGILIALVLAVVPLFIAVAFFAFMWVWLLQVLRHHRRHLRSGQAEYVRWRFRPETSRRLLTIVGFAAGCLLFTDLLKPWAPREELQVVGRERPVVGYVLGTKEGSHFVLLIADVSATVWVKAGDVEQRRLCAREPTSLWLTTLDDVIFGAPAQASCD